MREGGRFLVRLFSFLFFVFFVLFFSSAVHEFPSAFTKLDREVCFFTVFGGDHIDNDPCVFAEGASLADGVLSFFIARISG